MASTQWNSTSFVTTVQVGSVPASAQRAGGHALRDLVGADQLVGCDRDARDRDHERGDRDAPRAARCDAVAARPSVAGGGQIGVGGALEAVAEFVELRVELGHRVISMESKRCLRKVLRPRETRARTACGVVASCSAASS